MSHSFNPNQVDPMLLNLFRQEMEQHVVTLNEGLLRLERLPSDQDALSELMRAAHSIKGAARILDLSFCVSLAHRMEDMFQQSKQGARELNDDLVDTLFGCIDLFEELGDFATPEKLTELDSLATRFVEQDTLLAQAMDAKKESKKDNKQLQANASTEPPPADDPSPDQTVQAPVVSKTSSPEPRKPSAAPPENESTATENDSPGKDTFVRVNAESLDRMVALSGENLIRNHWLISFVDGLSRIRLNQSRLNTLLKDIEQRMIGVVFDTKLWAMFKQYQLMSEEVCGKQLDHWLTLEEFTREGSFHAETLHYETVNARLRPFGDGTYGLARMVRDVSRELGKKVNLEISGEDTLIDRDILEKLEAPMTHLLRNALDHGVESPSKRVKEGKKEVALLTIEAAHVGGMFQLSVEDDGRGIDVEHIRAKVIDRQMAPPEVASALSRDELLEFLFLPGFTTKEDVTEISGRGVGMDIVHHLVGATNGSIQVFTEIGLGTKVVLRLPISLSVVRTLIVQLAGEPYAFRLNSVDSCTKLSVEDIQTVEGRQFVQREGRNVSLLSMRNLLGLPPISGDPTYVHLVFVSDRFSEFALIVDRFMDEQELVVHPLDPRLGHLPGILAASVLSTGEPVVIVDTEDLVKMIALRLNEGRLGMVPRADLSKQGKRKRVLVVDDSITVRELERQLLETCQYHVDVAVDGQDGWNALLQRDYDLVVTDVDMPRMDGITLTKKIRKDLRFHRIPVIIVSYKDREEDRMAGLNAGASHYLTKGSFSDNTFTQSVTDLIGEATS